MLIWQHHHKDEYPNQENNNRDNNEKKKKNPKQKQPNLQTNGKHTHSYIYKEKYKNNNTNKTKKIWEKASKTKKNNFAKGVAQRRLFQQIFFLNQKISLRIFFKNL